MNRVTRRIVLSGAVCAAAVGAGAEASAVEVIRGTSRSPSSTPWARIFRARPGIHTPNVPRPTRSVTQVVASLDERRLVFDNAHTDERLRVTYWRDGAYDDGAVAEINHLMRDWRSGSVHPIAVEVLDLLTALRRTTGSRQPIQLLSAYRTPETNEMLRRLSPARVARDSLHMQGRAVDFFIPGVRLADLRDHARSFGAGGVGYYPGSGFVHIDNGPVRTWS